MSSNQIVVSTYCHLQYGSFASPLNDPYKNPRHGRQKKRGRKGAISSVAVTIYKNVASPPGRADNGRAVQNVCKLLRLCCGGDQRGRCQHNPLMLQRTPAAPSLSRLLSLPHPPSISCTEIIVNI